MKGRDIDNLPPEKVVKMVEGYLGERFGITREDLSGFGMYLASKGRVYLGPEKAIDRPRIVTIGLLIARVSRSVKPSTNLLQLFGRRISRNRISLEREQAVAFARGDDLRCGQGQASSCTDGYVLLSYEGFPLGCGFLQGGAVKNLVPKAKRLGLKYL
jgi:NOL1/NOP2/fmu family ribosome biogenesis protein